MLHYSTYIYPVVFTYVTCQVFSFLASKTDNLCSGIYFEKCMFCYFINIRALPYYGNDVYIVNIQMGKAFIMFCDIISCIDIHLKRAK